MKQYNLNKQFNSIQTIAKLFALAFIIGGSALAAVAAPPANDNYANAQLINVVSGQVIGTNVEATRETNEPVHAFNRGGKSVWYKYVATGNGVLTINTTGSSFDTLLAVYNSAGGINNLAQIAANDDIDSASNFQSQVTIGVASGAAYYIAVDGFFSGFTAVSGSVKLNFSLDNVAANDNFSNAIQLSGAKGKMITTSNVGASKETGEPNHAGQSGGKSVWYKWTAPAGSSKSYSFSVQSQRVNSFSGVNTLLAIYTGTSVGSLTPVANRFIRSSGTYSNVIFIPTPGTTYYIALDGYLGVGGTETGTFTLNYDINKSDKTPDFDRDGKADITVFRPTTGIWYTLDSLSGDLRSYAWGQLGDKPLFADFQDNGVSDYSVYRPDLGAWYIYDTQLSNFQGFSWGANTDVPLMVKTYSHDDISGEDISYVYATVFRPQTGTWYMLNNQSGEQQSILFGQSGDVPVAADFNGDGNDELAVFRPSTGTWYILNRKTNQYQTVPFGQSGDKPVAADYDADGKADIAVYRPSNGAWYVLRSGDGQFQAAQFGASTDIPQPADYDGDGKADYAVFRPSNGTWYLQQSSNGFKGVAFGAGNDVPLTAPIAAP